MQGIRIIHLMPTFKQCKDIHKDLALADLLPGGDWAWLDAKIDRTSWHFQFPGGSWIQWFGAREANSARGIRCDIVTMDEQDDIDPSVVDSVVKPWFSEPWSLRMLLGGGTPRRGRYGLLYREHVAGLKGLQLRAASAVPTADPTELARARALRRKSSFHATHRDAPETVDPSYVAEQRAEYEASGKLAVFKREWECDFDSAEGLVYPMFDAAFHVREPPAGTMFSEFLIGGDFGWEDPGVFLEIGVAGHGKDATCYILDEVYQTQRDNSWWDAEAKKLIQKRPSAKWYPDNSRPDRLADLRRLGARVQHAEKPQVEASVGAIADKLAIRYVGDALNTRYAKLYVSPKCVNTIAEFGKYRRRRDPQNSDRFLDDIEDKNNHCLVAGTKVATDTGEVAIEDVIPGDLVLTRAGLRKVIASGQTFVMAEIWRMDTSDGRRVEGTADHRIWTANRGWVRIDAMRYGDILEACPSGCQALSESSSTAFRIVDIQIPASQSCETTSLRSEADGYTRPFGSTITGPFSPGGTSITEMTTRSTTISPTWNACLQESMRADTCPWSDPRSSGRTSDVSERWRPTGIGAWPGAHGMQSMVEQRGQRERPLCKHASNAGRSSSASRWARNASAPIPVNRSGAEMQGQTTNHAPVEDAEPSSKSTNTGAPSAAPVHVLAAYAAQRTAPVYDLTVDDAHEFYANGILVHNSMDALRYPLFGRFGSPERTRHEEGAGW